ncbi:hypothetical protein WN55_04853 [Dufourea novaeangliae]|uniref:Uncharacterized protein n=1 Tax=Dufourea novaeangliae TaxID=178035 RepID=A0A154PM72_DUFNO|nr:hypothetical protein WN55_04853 [Dufourea novaeangliae]
MALVPKQFHRTFRLDKSADTDATEVCTEKAESASEDASGFRKMMFEPLERIVRGSSFRGCKILLDKFLPMSS